MITIQKLTAVLLSPFGRAGNAVRFESAMKHLKIQLFLWILALLSPGAIASTWYVDKAAAGLNNGTSWINAWKSFAGIKKA